VLVLRNTYGDLEALVGEDEGGVSGGKIAVHCRSMRIGWLHERWRE
jgi:hypothetical protein